MQYFKTDFYYLCLWDEGMIVIEYCSHTSRVVWLQEYIFPRDWKAFFEMFKIAELTPIGEHEFNNMLLLAKIVYPPTVAGRYQGNIK